MLQKLLLLGLCLFISTPTLADDPTGAFLVPYRVVCKKQTDGTDEFRVEVALRKALHPVIIGGTTTTGIRTDTITTVDKNGTSLLQSKLTCKELASQYAPSKFLFGFDALFVGMEETAFYSISPNASTPNFPSDLCAYLINVSLDCCGKTLEEKLADKVYLGDDETLAWVDLGDFDIVLNTFMSPTVKALMLPGAPYNADRILRDEEFDIEGQNNIQTILEALFHVASKNRHGLKCNPATFGMNQENADRILCNLLSKLGNCPKAINGLGEWGSCGETQKVKVTGTKQSPLKIDICGKTYCLTELPAVSGSSFTGQVSSTLGSGTAQCFTEFFAKHIGVLSGVSANAANTFNDFHFGACGIQGELEGLVVGRSFVNGLGQLNTYKLRLISIDPDTNTYGFLYTITLSEGELVKSTSASILGCRFKLEPCKKCC